MAYSTRSRSRTRHYPEQETRPQRRKAKPPQPPTGGLFSAKLVIAIFFIFVFVYIGHSIWAFWTPSVDTMPIRTSTIDAPHSITGIIIRDEKVFFAESDGYIEFWVPDNERVRVGATVASIQNPEMVMAATQRLSMVEAQAIDTQSRRHLTDTTVQSLNNNLNNMVNARIHNFASLNLSEIYSLRDSLNQVINTRNQININDGVAARDTLAREQELHTSVLEYNSRNMYAAASGIMSRIIDGQESNLTRASIGQLTQDDVRIVVDYDSLVPRQQVQAGDAAFKIVGNVWYVAADMPNNIISDFVEGTTRTIYLLNAISGEYEPHSLSIVSIDYGTRYSLVVFRSTRHVIEFLQQRNVSIRTTSGVQRGLKLPDTAIATRRYLRVPNGFIHGELERYVVAFGENGNTTIPVTVENTTDYNAYILPVPGLGVGSLLVPRNPEESHILLSQDHIHELHGIFLVRLGAASFRLVNLSESSVAAGYVLLNPAFNPDINEFANVVIDASTVVDGQLIR